MKVYVYIENDQQEEILRFNAPTVDMAIEKMGAWERKAQEPIDTERVCQFCEEKRVPSGFSVLAHCPIHDPKPI